MMKGKPFSKEEIENLKERLFVGTTVSRLLATVRDRDKTIEKLLKELHYLRSLCEEKRPTKVINFWLNKSLNKFESSSDEEEIVKETEETVPKEEELREPQIAELTEEE